VAWHQAQSYGRVTPSSPLAPLSSASDPFSRQFNPKVKDTPRALFSYLLACQVESYGTTILENQPSQRMHERHLKYLLQEFEPLTIKRAIYYASLRCKYPFGVRWIKTYSRYFKGLGL